MAGDLVQCTRCRNKHHKSDRISKPNRQGMNIMTCPRCGGRGYYDLSPRIAYCWASGLIEFGQSVPAGAIKLAHGPASHLKSVVEVMARHGRGESAGQLLVPGIPEAADQQAAGDALEAFIDWAGKGSTAKKYGVVFTSREVA